MAASAGSRSLARARGDVISICGSNPSPDAGLSRSELAAARGPHAGPTLETAKRRIVRAHVSGCIALSSIRIAVTRRLARAAARDVAEGNAALAQERRFF